VAHRLGLLVPWRTFTPVFVSLRFPNFQLGARTEQTDKWTNRRTGKACNASYLDSSTISYICWRRRVSWNVWSSETKYMSKTMARTLSRRTSNTSNSRIASRATSVTSQATSYAESSITPLPPPSVDAAGKSYIHKAPPRRTSITGSLVFSLCFLTFFISLFALLLRNWTTDQDQNLGMKLRPNFTKIHWEVLEEGTFYRTTCTLCLKKRFTM